ncbi:tellurium resistance protein TerC [Baekduia soli]|uniref:Tellurium resistance protein TerC n=1 Tax=Baekduia soli TaxID=496014 RepID=A0A5B8UCD4_9ACTN|nr:tellurium resistance protein TerC [Baekduia soli]QEC50312.1 tellurium resistance protein TerC [Baekduia soli]
MKWIALIGALAVLLAFDLWLARRERGGMSVRTATLQSLGWVVVALGFGAVMLMAMGGREFGLYFAGYLVEKSLSLDNVFVFLLILTSFGIPEAQRHRLLTWGIVAALVLRGVFIAVGATALHHASWIAYIFAALLIWTGWRMFQHRHDSAGETAFVDKLKARLSGRVEVAALAALVIADIVFAIDSVPSILAITDDPFIVFAANAFALLGLAPLFFLVADLVQRLYYLKTALAALLVLIGIKMAAGEAFGKLGPEISLPAIALVLGTGVVASLVRDRRLAQAEPSAA